MSHLEELHIFDNLPLFTFYGTFKGSNSFFTLLLPSIATYPGNLVSERKITHCHF